MKGTASETRILVKNILLATDFSPQSNAALPYALSIARKYGAKLFAVHVIPYPPPSPRGSLAIVKEQMEEQAKQAMGKLESLLHEAPHEAFLEKGDTWSAISDIIEAKGIDLVVIGTHGRTGVKKLFLGSVAEKIFRRAGCPVLTVGPNVSGSPEGVADIHEILYPTDFTPQALAAAPYAISLAQENQARLSMLCVVKDRNQGVAPHLLQLRLEDIVPAEAALWCKPQGFIRYGSPDVEILDLARERAVDLIVLGVQSVRHYLSAATHLPWATAHRVVTMANCPVLTVRG